MAKRKKRDIPVNRGEWRKRRLPLNASLRRRRRWASRTRGDLHHVSRLRDGMHTDSELGQITSSWSCTLTPSHGPARYDGHGAPHYFGARLLTTTGMPCMQAKATIQLRCTGAAFQQVKLHVRNMGTCYGDASRRVPRIRLLISDCKQTFPPSRSTPSPPNMS